MTPDFHPATDSVARSPAATASDRIIVALDVPDRHSALEQVARLEGQARWVKVGLELYLAEGRRIVEEFRNAHLNVFLDLKLHDIPNTVAGAVRSVGGAGASLLTLHACGGPAMLRAAKDAASAICDAPRLLAVTVLTSMDRQELAAAGTDADPAERVAFLGRMAIDYGMDGLICSPMEAASLRFSLGSGPLLVVPGIRSASDPANDQARTATPSAALQAGASMLVIGRPITRAADPADAFRRIVHEIDGQS